MHSIYLEPPEIQEHKAIFRWRITPEIDLYQNDYFTLEFPNSVDLSKVPTRLWWDILHGEIDEWKKDCDQLLLHYYSVPDQGAFVLDINK